MADRSRERELEDRLEELRAEVEQALQAHANGEAPERIFASLRKRLEHVPHGRWSPDLCIEKAHEWNGLHDAPPKAIDWNVAGMRGRKADPELIARYESGDWPSQRTIVRLFGNWTHFMVECGWEPRSGPDEPGGPGEHDETLLPEWTGWQFLPNWRERAGYSQNVLAHRAGIHNEYVSQMERGIKTNPRVRVLISMALALDLSPRAMMEYQRRQ